MTSRVKLSHGSAQIVLGERINVGRMVLIVEAILLYVDWDIKCKFLLVFLTFGIQIVISFVYPTASPFPSVLNLYSLELA